MAPLAKYGFLGETSGYITLSYIFCCCHIFNILFSTPFTLSHSQRHHFAPLDMDLQATTMGPSRGVKGQLSCFLQWDESAIGRLFRSAQSLLIGLDVKFLGAFPAQERAGPTSWTCSETAFAAYSPGTGLPQLLCPLLTPVPVCCSTPLVVSLPLPIPFDLEYTQWSLYQ